MYKLITILSDPVFGVSMRNSIVTSLLCAKYSLSLSLQRKEIYSPRINIRINNDTSFGWWKLVKKPCCPIKSAIDTEPREFVAGKGEGKGEDAYPNLVVKLVGRRVCLRRDKAARSLTNALTLARLNHSQ